MRRHYDNWAPTHPTVSAMPLANSDRKLLTKCAAYRLESWRWEKFIWGVVTRTNTQGDGYELCSESTYRLFPSTLCISIMNCHRQQQQIPAAARSWYEPGVRPGDRPGCKITCVVYIRLQDHSVLIMMRSWEMLVSFQQDIEVLRHVIRDRYKLKGLPVTTQASNLRDSTTP